MEESKIKVGDNLYCKKMKDGDEEEKKTEDYLGYTGATTHILKRQLLPWKYNDS